MMTEIRHALKLWKLTTTGGVHSLLVGKLSLLGALRKLDE
jgi:hypothetical protein